MIAGSEVVLADAVVAGNVGAIVMLPKIGGSVVPASAGADVVASSSGSSVVASSSGSNVDSLVGVGPAVDCVSGNTGGGIGGIAIPK
jgi:hypothetical protein